MSTIVREIMNHELLRFRPDAIAVEALARLLAFKVSGAPVMDDNEELVGVTSWRDLVDAEGTVSDAMSTPCVTLGPDDSIESAALLLAETGHHRLVVVESGVPVGVVSPLDVIRGLVGFPAAHPSVFPHFEAETSLNWSDDKTLVEKYSDDVPEVEGLLVLVRGGRGSRERVVWAEACSNLRQHLLVILHAPASRIPHLLEPLKAGTLRFRVAAATDITKRMAGLRTVLHRARDERRRSMERLQTGI